MGPGNAAGGSGFFGRRAEVPLLGEPCQQRDDVPDHRKIRQRGLLLPICAWRRGRGCRLWDLRGAVADEQQQQPQQPQQQQQ
jgi:hypothetical protein